MKNLLLFLILAATHICFGQTTNLSLISSSGDDYTSSNQQISWSLGEVATETYGNENTLLTQGFHQYSYTITSVNEPTVTDLKINVFPNPSNDFVTVQISQSTQQLVNYSIVLTDLQGKQLMNQVLSGDNLRLNLSELAVGSYFIIVLEADRTLQTFKILKSN
jgi:hypothetical protein